MTHILAAALILQLNNLAGAPPPVVFAAAAEVARMYTAIGVPIAWGDARTASDRDLVRVIVLPFETGDLRSAPDTVMGAAVVVGDGTRVAYVYYRRVRSEAERYGASTAQALACAIAHEVGHLLLPGEAHSPTGLMRASWGREDFSRADQGQLRFSAGQVARIRARSIAPSQAAVEDERRNGARQQLEQHDHRERREAPVALGDVLGDRDDDARGRRTEQDDDADLQQPRRDAAAAGGDRPQQADDEAERADRDAGAQHGADDALEPLGARLTAPARRHRPPRANIIADTMKSTAAIRIFSHFADADAPKRIPPHEPSCTPSTAAAASVGSSCPRP